MSIEEELEQPAAETALPAQAAPAPAKPAFDLLGWLKSPTGEGDVSTYMQHPLNFLRTEGNAQLIRGLTGLLGNLNLAIVDIVLGGMRIVTETKRAGHGPAV